MAQDEIQRLIMEVVNAERVKELNGLLKDERDTILELKQRLDAGKISQQQYEQSTQNVGRAIKGMNDEIKELGKQSGISSHSLMQFQYILDDLLNTSGGIERKLGAISNNIPGFIQSLGGSGMAGAVGIVTTALIALVPVAKAAWEALAGEEEGDKAKERIEEVRRKIAEAHKEFEKLSNAPNDPEKLSAEGIGLFLKQRPNADRARAAVAAGMSGTEAIQGLPEDEQKRLMALLSQSNQTDDALRMKAEQETATSEGPAPPQVIQARYEQLARERARAGAAGANAMNAARRQAAEGVIAGATKAGPEGYADRERLLRLTEGKAGFEELQGYRPERIAADEAEYEEGLPAFEAIAESGRALSRGLRKRRAREKKQDEARARLQHAQTDAALAKSSKKIADDRKAQQSEDRALEQDERQNAQDWQRAKKSAPQRRAKQQVTRAAQQLGYGTPTDAQADQMASQVLSLTAQGVETNQAILSAITSKAQEIERLRARLQQQQMQASRLMGGTDNGGDFSMMPGAF